MPAPPWGRLRALPVRPMIVPRHPEGPDDPHTGQVGHLLVVDRGRDVWWRVWPDGTRTLVGGRRAAERLVRGWLAWTDPPPVPLAVGASHQPASEYVGDRYTVLVLDDPAELDAWPNASPVRVLR